MAKSPSIQFYPGDWQRDTALKMCSLAARGLWAEMLWLMFDGEPFGHLSVKGSVIPPDKLGVIVGVGHDEVERLLAELEQYGVFSRNEAGIIYSRRMVRDFKRRETNALNGSKGGNPRLSKSVNRMDKPSVNHKVNPLTADAVCNKKESIKKERATLVDRIAETFEDLWNIYERYGSKAKALAYWRKLSAQDRDGVMAKVREYVDSTPGCEYRKQLEGWINPDNRLWERPIVKRSGQSALSSHQATLKSASPDKYHDGKL